MRKTVLWFLGALSFSLPLQAQENEQETALKPQLTTRTVEIDRTPPQTTNLIKKGRSRLSFGGYHSEWVSDDAREYAEFKEKTKSGYALDGSYQYFFGNEWGIGLDGIYINHSGNFHPIAPDFNLSYVYLGMSAVFRAETSNKRFALYVTLGIGPLFYTQRETDRYFDDTVLHRTTISAVSSLSGEVRLNRSVALGIKFTGQAATFTDFNANGDKVLISANHSAS